MHVNPDRFVGQDVVVTEKLDGGNTLPHAGKVYARSVSAPAEGKADRRTLDPEVEALSNRTAGWVRPFAGYGGNVVRHPAQASTGKTKSRQ